MSALHDNCLHGSILRKNSGVGSGSLVVLEVFIISVYLSTFVLKILWEVVQVAVVLCA